MPEDTIDTNTTDDASRFSLVTAFVVPSGGKISSQFLNGTFFVAQRTDLSKKKIEEVFDALIMLSMKLSSLWNIKNSYDECLEKAKEEVKNSESRKGVSHYSLQSTDLMGWMDVYLVQIKSTLDHLVKFPSIIFGYNRWSLATFGDRGEKVRRAFSNLPREYRGRTKNFYEGIFGSQTWINDIIEMRDRLNHGIKGGGDPGMFRISYDENADSYSVPMWNQDQSLHETIDIVFDLLLSTCGIFCGTILSLKLPDNLSVACEQGVVEGNDPICKVVDREVFESSVQRAGLKMSPVEDNAPKS